MNIYLVTRRGWDIEIAIVRASTPVEAVRLSGSAQDAEVIELQTTGDAAVLWEHTDNGPDSR
jgi:hypothetical protein